MGRRREPRLKLEVPVKVCGMDTSGHPFVQTAYAVSISRTGVRLTGVGPLVRVGEIVVVIYKQRKARFRVAWIGEAGQPEFGQAGLETSDSNTLIWDFTLPHAGIDGYSPVAPGSTPTPSFPRPGANTAPGTANAPGRAPSSQIGPIPGIERRNSARFDCRGSAEIFIPSVSFPTRGQIDDISLSGVYIQTTAPLLVGNDVKLNLSVQSFTLQAEAQVRTSHPGVGMGLMFTKMNPENRQILGAVINRLGGASAAASVSQSATAPPPPRAASPRWDSLGREISEWFRTHETLTREEFYTMLRPV